MRKGKELADALPRLLPLISFAVPLAMLYSLNPASFEATWKGRTYHLFFIWLILLETILNWETLQPKLRLKSVRFVVLSVCATLPTLYIVAANYIGLDSAILDLSTRIHIPLANLMALSCEYMVFTVFLATVVLVEHGMRNLGNYAVSVFFAGTIGAIYAIDNLYPYGRFAPFQLIVPTTTMLAAGVLGAMGYATTLSFRTTPEYGAMTYLSIRSPAGRSAAFGVAWPCSGVESLLIYAVTILLFLKSSSFSWMSRIVCFVVGALVTYLINVLRIVTIFVISVQGGDIWSFHDYYGQLYSIVWIISYPLIILGLQSLWNRRKASRQSKPVSLNVST